MEQILFTVAIQRINRFFSMKIASQTVSGWKFCRPEIFSNDEEGARVNETGGRSRIWFSKQRHQKKSYLNFKFKTRKKLFVKYFLAPPFSYTESNTISQHSSSSSAPTLNFNISSMAWRCTSQLFTNLVIISSFSASSSFLRSLAERAEI